MGIVHSYSVGDGDMFPIRHGSDSFTVIDCSLAPNNQDPIVIHLSAEAQGKQITHLISTHPDEDHLKGLKYLDEKWPIANFYCVRNNATKPDESEDFKHYCGLRDGGKAYYISKGCARKWLNQRDNERDSAGIHIYWPDTENEDYRAALRAAATGNSPNNISPIIVYHIENGASFMWMGDLETAFMEKTEEHVEWPNIDILFAPHHGRESGKIPNSILRRMGPSIIVIGEAPARHLNYYQGYNTITQNTAGHIAFECVGNLVHIYVGSSTYKVSFLGPARGTKYKNCIGTLVT